MRNALLAGSALIAVTLLLSEGAHAQACSAATGCKSSSASAQAFGQASTAGVSVTIPASASSYTLLSNAPSNKIYLPGASGQSQIAITVPNGSGGSSASVLLVPPAGYTITDGITTSLEPYWLQAVASFSLTRNDVAKSYTIDTTPIEAANLTMDFVNGKYNYAFNTETTQTTLAGIFTADARTGGTTVNSAGVITDAAAGYRFPYSIDYTPTLLGMELEPASQNLVPNNAGTIAWTLNATKYPVADTTDPALYQGASVTGSVWAARADGTTTSLGSIPSITMPYSASQSQSCSIYVNISPSVARTLSAVSLSVTGTGAAQDASVPADIQTLGTWQRISVEFHGTAAATLNVLQAGLVAGDQVLLTAPQCEATQAPTSYIPDATGIAATRTADTTPEYTSGAYSGLSTYTDRGGATLLVSAITPTSYQGETAGTQIFYGSAANNVTSAQQFGISDNGAGTPSVSANVVNGGVSTRLDGSPITAGRAWQAAISIGDYGFRFADHGSAPDGDKTPLPQLARYLGITNTAPIYLRRIELRPGTVSDATLSAMAHSAGPYVATVGSTSLLTLPANPAFGYSQEISRLTNSTDISTEAGLISLYNNVLGPTNVRFGGATCDISTVPTAAQIKTGVNFAAAMANGSTKALLDWCIPFYNSKTATYATSSADVTEATSVLGDGYTGNVFFNIGNELDLYFGTNATSWSTEQSGYDTLRSGLTSGVSGIKLSGPQLALSTGPFLSAFMATEGSYLSQMSLHNYLGGTYNPTPDMMANAWNRQTSAYLFNYDCSISTSLATPIPTVVDEGGSFSASSDILPAALGTIPGLLRAWTLAANQGVLGFANHGTDNAPNAQQYSAQWLSGGAVGPTVIERPNASFYAAWLFNQLVPSGAGLMPITGTLPANVQGMATKDASGVYRVMFTNLSRTMPVTVTIGVPGMSSLATHIIAEPSYLGTTLDIDGVVIPDNGTGWVVPTPTPHPATSSSVTLYLPPAASIVGTAS